jgi:hypothetical protein
MIFDGNVLISIMYDNNASGVALWSAIGDAKVPRLILSVTPGNNKWKLRQCGILHGVYSSQLKTSNLDFAHILSSVSYFTGMYFPQ